MKPIIFSLHLNPLFEKMIKGLPGYERGKLETRLFPDDETYLRIYSDLKQRKVILIDSLDRPNTKTLPLLFFAKAARASGAESVGLIAPYLAYMRQDIEFNKGEVVTSRYFAEILSHSFDWLITIDPHLHRYKSLDEIYSIPTTVLHACNEVANWIKHNVSDPIIIGPDRESEQWVADIASRAQVPYLILEKNRKGDAEVEISLPRLDKYKTCTPIIVDDIISTAKTTIETVKHLQDLKMKPAICIGIHAVFAGDSYQELSSYNVKKIITCNTIEHSSNGIDISHLLINSLGSM